MNVIQRVEFSATCENCLTQFTYIYSDLLDAFGIEGISWVVQCPTCKGVFPHGRTDPVPQPGDNPVDTLAAGAALDPPGEDIPE